MAWLRETVMFRSSAYRPNGFVLAALNNLVCAPVAFVATGVFPAAA